MDEHVVPPELSLDDVVQTGLFLDVYHLGPGLVVHLADRFGVLTADEVASLVSFQVGERCLRPVGEREQPRGGRNVLGHAGPFGMRQYNNC